MGFAAYFTQWMRLNNFWSRPSFGDVASAASYDFCARNAIVIFWSRPSFGDVASTTSHDIGARSAIEFFVWRRPSFGDVACAATHGIGARNAIEEFFEVDQAWEMLRVPLVTIFARAWREMPVILRHGQQCNVTYRKPRRDLPGSNPVVSHFFTLIISYREA